MANSIANLYEKESKNVDPKWLKNKDIDNLLVDEGLNTIGKKLKSGTFISYRLRTNTNEQWDKRYHKVIRSLENKGISLRVTNRKISRQKVRFLEFLIPFRSVRLPLMENVLMPLAKNVLVPLWLMATASATDTSIQKKIFGSGMTALIISS